MIPDECLDEDWGDQLQHRPHHLLADAGRWARAESEDFVAIVSETIKLGFLIDEDMFGSKVNLSNVSCSKILFKILFGSHDFFFLELLFCIRIDGVENFDFYEWQNKQWKW